MVPKIRVVRFLHLHEFGQLPTLRSHRSPFGKRYLGWVYVLHCFHQQLPSFLRRGSLQTGAINESDVGDF